MSALQTRIIIKAIESGDGALNSISRILESQDIYIKLSNVSMGINDDSNEIFFTASPHEITKLVFSITSRVISVMAGEKIIIHCFNHMPDHVSRA